MSKTDFGYEKVTLDEKTKRVGKVFTSVAGRYDLMNNLMSLGIHHLWKRYAVDSAHIRKGQTVLDLAGGSGDLTRLLAKKVGLDGQVVLADINAAMLAVGRNRLTDEGILKPVSYLQATAEALPLMSNKFDAVFIAFGLRNVSNKQKALASMYRVCKPGGRMVVLEFTQPQQPIVKQVYDWYSFEVLPRLGEWVAGDAASYRYLSESIRMHPAPDVLKAMIEEAGFEDCSYELLTAGVVALHVAYKY